MCINFTPTRKAPWVKKNFGLDLPSTDYPAEAYPGYVAPIVVKSHQSGRTACGLARFGLIPAWAKDDKINFLYKMYILFSLKIINFKGLIVKVLLNFKILR